MFFTFIKNVKKTYIKNIKLHLAEISTVTY